PKDMVHAGRPQLAGWIRTTWLPYLDRVPDVRRGDFAEALLERYAAAHPADERGAYHVAMVRLEVEARKPR
ncbi:MAG: SAM-dependent methyltransferase, partial [Gemmatimonadota bacterium]